MKNVKWLSISALGCFLLIFGSTIGTYIFSTLWLPRIENITSLIVRSFTLIFEITSYFVLGGAGIIVICLIIILLNHNRLGIMGMLIGSIIALLAILLYFFGAIEASLSYTIQSERPIVLLPLLTINFTFELIGLILNFLSRTKLTENRIY